MEKAKQKLVITVGELALFSYEQLKEKNTEYALSLGYLPSSFRFFKKLNGFIQYESICDLSN